MVSDIVPVVSFVSSDPSIIYDQTEVSFDVKLLNPENLNVSYQWIFPKGTKGTGVDEQCTSGEVAPVVTFGTIGSQKVILNVTMGEKRLAPLSVDVRVNYNKPVKKLYYAVKDGNIMARNIIGDDVDQAIVKPFDLGYRSGKHPMTLKMCGDWLYVFDAGTKVAYAGSGEGLGDGEIYTVAFDGSKRETIVENFGGNTYSDFYYGLVDEQEGMIYWTDRREGIFRTSIDTRNSKFSQDEFNYFVRNNWLGYYGKGIYWGNVNGPIAKLGDTFWWAKNSNGAGVFRFLESDIKGQAVSAEEPAPAAGSLLNSFTVRGMAIDELNGHIYIASQSHKAIVCFDLATGGFEKQYRYDH